MPHPKTLILTDGSAGGAAAATAHLVAGLESLHPGKHQWWHFSPSSVLTENKPALSLDPSPKRPTFERILKNVSRPLADKLRRKRHRLAFHQRIHAELPSIINFHNIHSCGLNHDDLQRIPAEIPIVWTMHDCWSFNVRAFEWINQVTKEIQFLCDDLPHQEARQRREELFRKRQDLVLVAPSKWLAHSAREVVGPEIRIEHIPYGICSETFQPSPVTEARNELGLDPDKVWLGIAATHAHYRKGLDVLAAALHQIDCQNIGLLSWGQKPDLLWPDNLEVNPIGHVSDQKKIARLYAACDLFVCPSRSDNLPNTILESLACGIPVIGSDAGGIPDMVRPEVTGWVFSSDHPKSCANSIRQAITQRENWPNLKANCRQIALEDYSLQRQATSYSKLFAELLSSKT